MPLVLDGKPLIPMCYSEADGDDSRDARRVSIPEMTSEFERLVYAASLANTETRRLSGKDCRAHCLQFSLLSVPVAQIWRQHHVAFEEWLSLTLEQKLADLEDWASTLGVPRAELAGKWLQPEAASLLVPRGVMPPELGLFHNDLEILRTIIHP